MNPKDLKKLTAIAELALQKELSDLAVQAAKERVEKEALEALLAQKAERLRARSQFDGFDPATLADVDGKWARWADKQALEMRRKLALAAAAREDQLVKTQRAFGRNEALKGIIRKLDRK